MIKSMTGYGAAEKIDCGKHISVEIRCVNHRYCDINIKTPRSYAYLEETLRKRLSKYITRGKADVYLNIEGVGGDDGDVILNSSLAEGYYNAMKALSERFSLCDSISLGHLIRFSDVFTVRRADEDSEEIARAVDSVAAMAGEAFCDMRQREGEKLYEDLLSGIEFLSAELLKIEARSPQIVGEYTSRLRERMKEILNGYPVDENRLLSEVAVFAERIDINEEIVRLKSHFNQMRGLLSSEEPVGRKLDFLIQEMNREINTIGSKSNDLEVARTVIEIKSGIEKLREQAQNIE